MPTTNQSWDPDAYARNARFVSDLGAPVVDGMDRSPLDNGLKGHDGTFDHQPENEEGPKMEVTTVGIDLAKNVFPAPRL